jgi:hypothetical protein
MEAREHTLSDEMPREFVWEIGEKRCLIQYEVERRRASWLCP